jgi:hypothetical protein
MSFMSFMSFKMLKRLGHGSRSISSSSHNDDETHFRSLGSLGIWNTSPCAYVHDDDDDAVKIRQRQQRRPPPNAKP